jgi:LEA14-like dessication related protein
VAQVIRLVQLSFIMLFAGACSQPKQLQYQDVKNFRIENLNFTKPEIGMDIQFYNPNSFGLSLKDASIDVYINDKLIGNASMSTSFSVPALDTFLMPVTLSADLSKVLPNALQLVFNKEVDVRLTGYVKAGRGVLLNIPISYKGRHKLNLL